MSEGYEAEFTTNIRHPESPLAERLFLPEFNTTSVLQLFGERRMTAWSAVRQSVQKRRSGFSPVFDRS